jgi:hypothetical protein
MSTISQTNENSIPRNYDLKIVATADGRKDLYVDNTKVPIDRTRYCWTSDKSMTVVCNSVKKGKEAYYSIEFPSLEKVKKCIELLIANTDTHLSIPKIKELTPTTAGWVTFTFDNDAGAKEFVCYYASPFFPKDEFECKLEGNRCVFICNPNLDDQDQIARVNQAFTKLDSRLYGHDVHELLWKNWDRNFPGNHYKQEPSYCVQYDYSGTRERYFHVKPEGIERSLWVPKTTLSKYGHFATDQVKEIVSSNYEEVDDWINRREPDATFCDKKCWQNLFNEMEAQNNPAFKQHIEGIRKFLEDFDNIKFDQLLNAEPLDNKDSLPSLESDEADNNNVSLPEEIAFIKPLFEDEKMRPYIDKCLR